VVLSAAEAEEWTSNTVADCQRFVCAVEHLKFLHRPLTFVHRLDRLLGTPVEEQHLSDEFLVFVCLYQKLVQLSLRA
jgi:hypothetical protein